MLLQNSKLISNESESKVHNGFSTSGKITSMKERTLHEFPVEAQGVNEEAFQTITGR
jgi:hypothetical protein